ncbi:MAG: gliding motility-associated C-terminal domain-containing protein, partial [Saprospiraceae bacterium]|nr:gliding motility-associated C-terminal domain-containing protein [Saprospiraceae bacterium]
FAISLNGVAQQTTDVFPVVLANLAAGQYDIAAADLNGCETQLSLALPDPPPFTVNLGQDTSIFLGDSVRLEAILSHPAIDSFSWTPLLSVQQPDALVTDVKPLQTTPYRIWVRDVNGCIAEDEVLVIVLQEKRVYIPNVIQPGSGTANGTLTVYGGPELAQIRFFRVYDRWGECVFEQSGVTPNQPAQGWSGQYRGKDVAPGVYVYVVELEYGDGTTEVVSGDVTVVR